MQRYSEEDYWKHAHFPLTAVKSTAPPPLPGQTASYTRAQCRGSSAFECTVYHREPASNLLSKAGGKPRLNNLSFFRTFFFISLLADFYSQFGFHGLSRWKPEQVYSHLGEVRAGENGSWYLGLGLQDWSWPSLSLWAKETPGNPAEIAEWDIWYGTSPYNNLELDMILRWLLGM